MTRAPTDDGLNRSLKNRHIQLIALGGTIGLGLFLASGAAIRSSGPGLLASYAVGGLMFFLLLRALGELALYRPVSGSFADYAHEFISPFAGFFVGWTYWGTYVVVGMAEATAIGKYTQFWFPQTPQWLPALIVIVVLFSANACSVRVFGEIEFWAALVKILAVLALIATGVVILIGLRSGFSEGSSVDNLWKHGGVFPKGIDQSVLALQIVVFSFFGLETLGVSAGEAEDPQRSLPKAINRVIVRIMLFYIGSLAVIMCLVPWNRLDIDGSPFVLVFDQIGLPAAASVINAVVIAAAFSVGNTAIYVTARMLYALAQKSHAPQVFSRTSARGVPTSALTMSFILMLATVVVNYVVPDDALSYIMSLATLGGLVTWVAIMVAHIAFVRAAKRGQLNRPTFAMPWSPYSDIVVLVFIGLIVGLIATSSQALAVAAVALVWSVAVGGMYLFKRCTVGENAMS